MADKKTKPKTKTKQKKAAAPKVSRPRRAGREMTLTELFKKRKAQDLSEFKPDANPSTWGKTLHLTRQQQLRLTKWGLYTLTIILCLVLQDVIMSQVSIFGATTNLAVCAILLITVMEGTEVGSLFVLIASTLYYFSGTAPGAYCIALMTFLGFGVTWFRQMYLHRSRGSIILSTAVAVTGYQLGLFITGLVLELTRFSRVGVFLLTAVLCVASLVPLYSLIHRIGLIGGNTWKE